MAAVRQKGTAPEVALRQELYRNGLRYRVNFAVLKKPRRVADVAFPSLNIAVFVDGCFWHGCPKCYVRPKQHRKFWDEKVVTNQARDRRQTRALKAMGWRVLRLWECALTKRSADRTMARLHRMLAAVG